VLVQKSTWLNGKIRQQCDNKNEFHGAIGVYFPNSGYGHKKYLYRAYDGIDAVLSEKVIRSVIQYSNAQMMDKLYTWQGVSNALLRDRLSSKGAELLAAETEKDRVAAEADEPIESVDEDIQKLKKQVEELTHANEILTYENQGLRSKMSSTDNMPILFLGEEDEFFQDEIRAMLLDALKIALPQYASRPRRKAVLEDIIKSNDCKRRTDERSKQLKNLLKGYKTKFYETHIAGYGLCYYRGWQAL
jgi:predicted RNase H-like nuclease (RuvC/YqgF family)